MAHGAIRIDRDYGYCSVLGVWSCAKLCLKPQPLKPKPYKP